MSLVLAVMFTVIAVAALAALLVLALTIPTSPLCVRRHVAAEVEAPELKPEPEPKIPRDTSRPYPRPKGHRSKLNRICPVCGTGSETGDLDRRVLGWPAHRTCAEWLGDWKPARPAPPPYKPDEALIGYIEKGQGAPKRGTGSTNTVIFTGNGAITAAGGGGGGSTQNGSFPIATADDLARAQMSLECGAFSIDEARQRILSAFSVPDPVMWSAAGDRQPLTRRWRCACGAIGYMEGDLAIHRRWCPMER